MMGSKTTDIESCNCYNFGTFIFPLSNQQIAYIFPYFNQFSSCWDNCNKMDFGEVEFDIIFP